MHVANFSEWYITVATSKRTAAFYTSTLLPMQRALRRLSLRPRMATAFRTHVFREKSDAREKEESVGRAAWGKRREKKWKESRAVKRQRDGATATLIVNVVVQAVSLSLFLKLTRKISLFILLFQLISLLLEYFHVNLRNKLARETTCKTNKGQEFRRQCNTRHLRR